MKEVFDFIKKCGCYYLATCEGDQPRVRPFGTVNIFEGKLYIQTGHVKPVDKQIAKNPKVEICAFDGQNSWIRVSATLAGDERIEAKRSMLDSYPELKKMYDAEDGNTAVYYLKDATAIISSFVNPPREIKF